MNDKINGFGIFLGGLVMGGLAGATIALLTAPRSGEETRAQIQAKGVELRGDAEQAMDDVLEKVNAAAIDVSTRAEELRTQTQAVLDEAQKQRAEAIDEIKQVAVEAIEETRTAAAKAV